MRDAKSSTDPEGELTSAYFAVQHARPDVTERNTRREAVPTGVPVRDARSDAATNLHSADAPGIDAFAGSIQSALVTPTPARPRRSTRDRLKPVYLRDYVAPIM